MRLKSLIIKWLIWPACFLTVVPAGYSQTTVSLAGQVSGESNQNLSAAVVSLTPAAVVTITDDQGRFALYDLSRGTYRLSVSFIGYQTHTDTLMLTRDTTVLINLIPAALSLHEIVITDPYPHIRRTEESLSVEVVNEQFLKRNLGNNLIQSLERLPGVSAMDIGSGMGKPVIRGLGFNRIVLVENGIRHEAQQWGADHGTEIDQYAIDQAEVIKGPASLRYGSDALAGVIEVRNRRIPAKNSIRGTLDLTGKTNNAYLGSSVSLAGRGNRLFGSMRFTLLDYADYRVPADSVDIYSFRTPLYERRLRNTAGKEQNVHLMMGHLGERLTNKLYISRVHSLNGFFAHAHGLEPRRVDTAVHDRSQRDILDPNQVATHWKVIHAAQYTHRQLRMDLDLGFQRNFRQEFSPYVSHGYMPAVFPDTLPFGANLERQFEKNVYTGKLGLSYTFSSQTRLQAGMSHEYQDNRIDGRGFIIPAYHQHSSGVFLLARQTLSEHSSIEAGLRYDHARLLSQAYHDWFPSPVLTGEDSSWQYLARAVDLDRRFQNLSWSLGWVMHAETWLVKLHLGKSFRTPAAKELSANGVNYHRFSYEAGDPLLDPEVSYQLDATVEYHAQRLAIGATPFVNYFANYIYLNPLPEHDRLYGQGNQIFQYTQSRVFRAGGEIHAHFEISKPLQLGLITEYIYARQISGAKKGYTLPFSPPASALLNIKYRIRPFQAFSNAWLNADIRLAARQNQIVPPEEPTAGHQVINLGFGGDLKIRNQVISVSAQIRNLFNTKYLNHISYYRLINIPEPGRNFILHLAIPVSHPIRNKQAKNNSL